MNAKSAKKSRHTFTFQPDPAVRQLVEEQLQKAGLKGKAKRETRTELLNRALRVGIPLAADVLAKQLQLETDALARLRGGSKH